MTDSTTGTTRNESELTDFIIARIRDHAEDLPATLTAETDLTRDVHIDSAAILEIVFQLEETFDVNVPINRLGDVRTVRELARLVAELS